MAKKQKGIVQYRRSADSEVWMNTGVIDTAAHVAADNAKWGWERFRIEKYL